MGFVKILGILCFLVIPEFWGIYLNWRRPGYILIRSISMERLLVWFYLIDCGVSRNEERRGAGIGRVIKFTVTRSRRGSIDFVVVL